MEWLAQALIVLLAIPITIWMAGAIYFDLCSGPGGRWVALAWVAGIVALFATWQPLWQPMLVLLAILALLLVWWFRQKPSHDREWEPAVAVLPRAIVQGESVTMENLRNFEYRSLEDFTPRYENRTYNLANLRGADVILFNWGNRWMSHPVLVFDFGPDGRICFSIEVRFRKGQPFAMLRSFYRQQELIVVAADERDVILRRTKHGQRQTAHLYRLTVPLDRVRAVFLDYVQMINDLCQAPRWYHAIAANCTTNFYRLPNSRPIRDIRLFVNGQFDRALYDNGRIDRSIPFDDLRKQARISEIANAAPEVGFGNHLRRELERRRYER